MAENFLNMGKEIVKVQKAQRTPGKINPRRNTLRLIVIKLKKKLKTERKYKSNKGKNDITYKRSPIKLSADFSTETLQTRREWHIQSDEREDPITKNILPSKTLLQI